MMQKGLTVFLETERRPRFRRTKAALAAGATSLLLASCSSSKPSVPEQPPPDWTRPFSNTLRIDIKGDTVDEQRDNFTNRLYDIAHGPCKIKGVFSLAVHDKPNSFYVVTEEKRCTPIPSATREIPQITSTPSNIKQINREKTLFVYDNTIPNAYQTISDTCGPINSDQFIPQLETRLVVTEKPCTIK